MKYTNSYLQLTETFSFDKPVIEFEDKVFHRCKFHSQSHDLLPGLENYYCKTHGLDFNNNYTFFNDIGHVEDAIHVKDVFVEENRNFNYFILKPKGAEKIKKVILLFHGFNEKSWNKYLPWGNALCEKTQSAVVFFPIAFHMQRAPQAWSEKRKMFALSEKRKKEYPNIIHSTLSNVAISLRLQYMPQRFIWSGLQTYYDVIRFIEDCKEGKHELIDKDFTFHIFAYSIGGLLAEILKLSDYKGYFSKSKIGLFCGGAVFNRLSPVSKFILDSEANVALYSYLVEHFESFLKKDTFLNHFIGENHLEGNVFHAMLDYQKMRSFREKLIKKYEKDFYAILLQQDSVIPFYEVINTLQGAARNIHIKVDVNDFNYEHTHENPFPVNHPQKQLIDESFEIVFDKFGNFFNF